jgi:outer membrane protein TolC
MAFPLKQNVIRALTALACASVFAPLLSAQQSPASQPSARTPVQLTLAEALKRAQKIEVTYQASVTNAAIAHEDKIQARDALLPSVAYNNSYIYTQGAGRDNSVRFIANNAVHEYISQGNVHESIDVAVIADWRRASATAAAARARAQIAARGLIVTVVQAYYSAGAAQKKVLSSQNAADEGERFFKLTQDLENGGEVAHSDVIKAELQERDRLRQLQEAKLALLNARLDLAVLIFPDFNDSFEIVDDLHAPISLPTFDETKELAARENPDIRAALESLKAAGHEVTSARAGYLPGLSFDYFYGIDAARFATRTDGIPNLGSSVVATLNIPIWNWGATQSRVRQAELQRDQSKRELSLTQRKLIAQLHALYAEAETSSDELASLAKSAELSKESLRLTTLRYKDGEATVLEVVDAQSTSTSADAAYHDGALRYRVALANLQTLTGVLPTP